MEKPIIKTQIACANCKTGYPSAGVPYCCPNCGGLFDFVGGFNLRPEQVDASQPGIWRYRHTFPLAPENPLISLGEGNTALVWTEVLNRKVAFKCEYINPSGSFKDRGSAVLTAFLKSRGVKEAVEDSSGNAGASFAAYAARSAIKARIFVPEAASGPKRRQIESYGAEAVPIGGLRGDVTNAVRIEAEAGTVYASHAYLPFHLAGYATIAYEIFEQLGKMPGAVILPAGQGGLLLGMKRGFDAIRKANNIRTNPKMIGVQASECAPLWQKFRDDKGSIETNGGGKTLAEGVQVLNPLRVEAVLGAIKASNGSIIVVDENEILPGREALARRGFYVEPTSAIVWEAITRTLEGLPDPVVVVLTGSGLKYG